MTSLTSSLPLTIGRMVAVRGTGHRGVVASWIMDRGVVVYNVALASGQVLIGLLVKDLEEAEC